ncbi:alpha/beta fold hydrolase [Pseudonocardiaceae bacterium YIM PH 21723]|nr:alpha/beta fold hydrolase [Pseudonocardiaceae bacterium YIM PH 21723]
MLLTALLPAPAQASTTTCQELRYPVTVAGSRQTMAGTLCAPANATTVQVLIPGATYNQSYWDYPSGGVSYREAMNRAGHATLNLDRLGAGRSSHPLSTMVTVDVMADAIHQVLGTLRPGFDRVVLVGHSLGSVHAGVTAARYSGEVDAVVLTGVSHLLNAVGAAPSFPQLVPVTPLDPLLAERHLDPGYITTRPGTREIAFHRPARVPQAALDYDEAHRDVLASGELLTAFPRITPLGTHTTQITQPVLLVNGQLDVLFCDAPAGADCRSADRLVRSEQAYFPQTTRLDAFVLPEAGHAMNFAPNAGRYHLAVIDWLRSAGFR